MLRWKVIPVLIGLTAGLDVYAQEAPAAPPFALPAAGSHRGVVDDTWIIAPKRLSDATLSAVKNYADEGDIAAGVSLRYRIDHAEWIIADVFIYPAGQGDNTKMLRQATDDFRESVAYAERQEIYRNVWWGDEGAYTASLSGGKKIEGRFLPIVFDAQQDMLTSRTYVFYRKLYFVKIRLTTTVDAVDSLAENADPFISGLLDGVEVISAGSCGRQMDIVAIQPGESLPGDLPDGVSADGYRMALKLTKAGTPAYGAQMAKAMALASKRQIASGCTTLDYHPPLEDGSRTVLHLSFTPGDWGSSAKP
ncbi:hypothetical protein BJI69_04675 [Luteibacter rhizovicinus DSM 16549]|uniref:Uncharacterized protein n=1 Tax=Luteibacter rhizovicinus DSM 16549 TaxID=1440763 RepID=A0A0G9HFU0_9GAMM|nr:hypothetical protein [Luteibacter rhizovicinus]APG03272.1 hypothetical protein BJI69_04675 [Luteibacter rhizovicinus DSM 16549]KLD68331.1 hypothetical protein Y883_02955 [Luteibacter rhizovicinus DSM 16549]KLD76516.1 hypothetical protein Y886_20850 [Xanthomonas hyacinthi DSM 19077]